MPSGRRGVSVKTLKRMLKKAGLKLGGRKAALTRRAKKAGFKVGGENPVEAKFKVGDTVTGVSDYGQSVTGKIQSIQVIDGKNLYDILGPGGMGVTAYEENVSLPGAAPAAPTAYVPPPVAAPKPGIFGRVTQGVRDWFGRSRRAKKAGLKLRGGDDAPCTTSTGAAGRCVALPARSDTRLAPASKDTVPPFPPPYLRTDGPAPTFLPKRSGGRSRKH